MTDGVATLRYAALLPSPCVRQVCDVDGDGPLAVSDGVSVLLRAAADLPSDLSCGQP